MMKVDRLGKSWGMGCKNVKAGVQRTSGVVAIGKWEMMGSIFKTLSC